ncbi:MAG: hypothetical protein KME60_33470 [Cyanomargarita calcarea GSE-NOS-MK-12-04C]|uniref:Uncharacterized protein n=1 Tax=Cyanomargarita calcarea GSE-NOS-MK-12-04C TaxID=2839659 RepID=A0A951QU84_9CYAN|nr:hypothetical protein [Cyanomargarita calcarea GSE-NOS-MK-12-04C]
MRCNLLYVSHRNFSDFVRSPLSVGISSSLEGETRTGAFSRLQTGASDGENQTQVSIDGITVCT